MKKSYLTQYLVAVWRGGHVKGVQPKVNRYELGIMKVTPKGQTFHVKGRNILTDKCETIAGQIKISKEKAAKLIAEGVKVSAGYFEN